MSNVFSGFILIGIVLLWGLLAVPMDRISSLYQLNHVHSIAFLVVLLSRSVMFSCLMVWWVRLCCGWVVFVMLVTLLSGFLAILPRCL